MGRSLPLDPTASPAHAVAHQLRELRVAAGEPSLDAMAAKATWSKTQLHAATTGRCMPTWDTVESFLRACKVPDDEMVEWRQRWHQHEAAMTVFKTATQYAPIEQASTQLPRQGRQVPLLPALLVSVLAIVLTALVAGTTAYLWAQPDPPETGDDPMISSCTGDALLVNTATVEGIYRLDHQTPDRRHAMVMAGAGKDQGSWKMADWEDRLLAGPAPAVFTGADLEGLAEPVRRHLARAIAPGTPLTLCARLTMRGSIMVGRWLPFHARQILSPHEGFFWTARVAGVIAGSDHYLDGAGGMNWKLAGLVTVAHADGPDVSRSAAGRGGAEAIWLPTALLPRFGVHWSAHDDTHIAARYHLGDTPIDVHYSLEPEGQITSLVFDRWGDPDKTGRWAWHPFGGEITGHRTFGGLTIPSAGRLGWHFGTDRWPTGEFFRYEITELQLLSKDDGSVP